MSLKKYSRYILESKLLEVAWQNVVNINSAHEAFYFFKSKLMAIIDNIVPLKYVCINSILLRGCQGRSHVLSTNVIGRLLNKKATTTVGTRTTFIFEIRFSIKKQAKYEFHCK